MNKNATLILVTMILAVFTRGSSLRAETPFLSNLSATGHSPLYTTYAAAMERSEFTLDEGFHFRFYEPERGVDFITDTAGDWCLAFKRGATYVYELKDMFEQPVIHASYPDVVVYSYRPFENVRVDGTFLVYSSRIAIHDVAISNTGIETVSLKVIPFLHNTHRTFNDVSFHPEKNAVLFTHEELPDGWVLEHDIPYVDTVSDIFVLSTSPDRMTSFRSCKWGDVKIPHQVDLDKEQAYLVRGRMHHQDGERCRHISPKPRMMVLLNEDRSRLLTESAPRWGSSDENVNRYAFYSIELGNFGQIRVGDRYTIWLLCGETGDYAVVEGTIGDMDSVNGERRDVVFEPRESVPIPANVKKDVWGGGREVRLYWDKVGPDYRYNVYRRDYRKSGVYALLAGNVSRTFYTDKDITGDQIYGYVVSAVDPQGRMSMVSEEVTNIAGSDFLTDVKYPDQVTNDISDLARVIALEVGKSLKPGAREQLRVIRGFARDSIDREDILRQAENMMDEDLEPYVRANEALYSSTPRIQFDDPDIEMLYWSAFSLMRQVMLPPEGKCGYNYYVFSREPTWGWGHGGQVFHESLTMLAYAHMDPLSAMNSQRVYLERQHHNGYINYRTGPYLNETIETDGELTSSAPWYAWQNWEIFRITRDRAFLSEMYASSKRFYDYYVSHRDRDGDGLCEWGAHAVLESVRDALVAVWDEVAWPSQFEGVDVNAMLVREAKALAEMASELGYEDEAAQWRGDAETRAQKINEAMWDEESGFYFHVDRKDNDFTYEERDDLKREEIIGFLPLWAGIASPEQAERLVEKLTDPNTFWRQYGVPTLAADDPYYNPKGYWNGPVWVEWNALIVDGLIRYGYREEANELVLRVARNMIARLKEDHTFWEFYSPDDKWGGYHQTYIWAGIIARMLMDVAQF